MTWTQFLAALARGGWSTDIDQSDEITCRSTCDDVVIESRWAGVNRKFAGATINGLKAERAELFAVLA